MSVYIGCPVGETVSISRGSYFYVRSSPEQGSSFQSASEAFLLV